MRRTSYTNILPWNTSCVQSFWTDISFQKDGGVGWLIAYDHKDTFDEFFSDSTSSCSSKFFQYVKWIRIWRTKSCTCSFTKLVAVVGPRFQIPFLGLSRLRFCLVFTLVRVQSLTWSTYELKYKCTQCSSVRHTTGRSRRYVPKQFSFSTTISSRLVWATYWELSAI